jgi:hypothetical protein
MRSRCNGRCAHGPNTRVLAMWSCHSVAGGMLPWRVPLVLVLQPFLCILLCVPWITTLVSSLVSSAVYAARTCRPA